MKIKSEFYDKKLISVKKDPDEWILNLEGFQIQMSKFGIKSSITDKIFMIHVLNNLPKEYNMILDGLEHYLTLSWVDAWTIEDLCKNLNHLYEKLKVKMKKSEKKKILGAFNKQC